MAVKASSTVTLITVRDIQATYRYYKLQSSTLAVPTQPTSIATLPPDGWTDTEPSYTEGSTNTLYTIDLTVFTDATFTYNPVNVSSSYEAAKLAYNKALIAQAGLSDLEDNLSTNYYTTSQTDSKISQTTTEITNSVASTYTLKTDTQTLATRVTSAETALTADALTVKISSALANANGTTSVTTNGVTIDKNGLTVDGGSFKVTNASSGILSVGSDGTLSFGNPINISQLATDLSNTITTTNTTANTALANAQTAQNTADNIEIGSRNLWISNLANKVFSTETTDGNKNKNYDTWNISVESNYPSSNKTCLNIDNYLYLEPDTEYIYSFWAKGYGTFNNYLYSGSVIQEVKNSSGYSSTTNIDGANLFTINTEDWTQYWVLWKTRSDLDNKIKRSFIPIRLMKPSTGTSSVYISCIMLERGNKATDWTPAPEDTQSQIDTLETRTTNWLYPDTTVIDGSKIYTGTITANKITTGTLTSASGVFGDINASSITSGYLSADRINAHTLNAEKLVAGTLTSASGVFGDINASSITSGYLSADRINAHTLNAEKLVAGTLTSASGVFGNINASSITSGYLSADRINSHTITTDKLTTDAITSTNYTHDSTTGVTSAGTKLDLSNGVIDSQYFKINSSGVVSITSSDIDDVAQEKADAIQIGGVNLIKNSDYIAFDSIETGSGTSTIIQDESSFYFYRAVPDTGIATGIVGCFNTFFIPSGDTYVASMYIKQNTNINQNVTFGVKNEDNTLAGSKTFTIKSGVWTQVYTDTLVNQASSAKSGYLFLMVDNINVSIDYMKEKVELGTKATDWTASPEDTIDKFVTINSITETLSQNIDANSIANWCYQSNLNQINGTKIAGGTVDTKALNCTELSAISGNLGTITTGKIQSPNSVICMDFTDESFGIRVRSITDNYIHVINSTGDLVYDYDDMEKGPVYQATNTGAKMDELIVKKTATIANLRIEQKTDGWIWITGI